MVRRLQHDSTSNKINFKPLFKIGQRQDSTQIHHLTGNMVMLLRVGKLLPARAPHLQLTKSRFHQALIPAEPAVIRQSWPVSILTTHSQGPRIAPASSALSNPHLQSSTAFLNPGVTPLIVFSVTILQKLMLIPCRIRTHPDLFYTFRKTLNRLLKHPLLLKTGRSIAVSKFRM